MNKNKSFFQITKNNTGQTLTSSFMSSAKYTLPPIKQPAGISVSKINNN